MRLDRGARLSVEGVIEGLAHERIGESIARPRVLGPHLGVEDAHLAVRVGAHLVGRAFPPPLHFEGGLDVDGGRQRHVDRAGQNRRDHRVRVADELHDDRVDRRAAPGNSRRSVRTRHEIPAPIASADTGRVR